jgi:hypothetical protein
MYAIVYAKMYAFLSGGISGFVPGFLSFFQHNLVLQRNSSYKKKGLYEALKISLLPPTVVSQ